MLLQHANSAIVERWLSAMVPETLWALASNMASVDALAVESGILCALASVESSAMESRGLCGR